MKMMQHLPHTGKDPEIVAVKQNQTADAPFSFTDGDSVPSEENKNEGEANAAADADAQMAASLQAEEAN